METVVRGHAAPDHRHGRRHSMQTERSLMARKLPALRGVLLGVVGILGFLALWQLAGALGWVNAKYVPPPTEVLAALGGDTLDLAFWRAVGDTLITWAIGLVISIVLALVLGTVIG